MERKIASLVVFLSLAFFFHDSAIAKKIYTLRSAFRQTYQLTDCNLLKVDLNSKGTPSSLSYRGHCCDSKKHTGFSVVRSSSSRGLEATFQWSHDNRYYLSAKSTGDQLVLEKPGSSVTNNHRFIIKTANKPGCRDCVTVQSKATNKYLSSGHTGQVAMTTNRKLNTALYRLHSSRNQKSRGTRRGRFSILESNELQEVGALRYTSVTGIGIQLFGRPSLRIFTFGNRGYHKIYHRFSGSN